MKGLARILNSEMLIQQYFSTDFFQPDLFIQNNLPDKFYLKADSAFFQQCISTTQCKIILRIINPTTSFKQHTISGAHFELTQQ